MLHNAVFQLAHFTIYQLLHTLQNSSWTYNTTRHQLSPGTPTGTFYRTSTLYNTHGYTLQYTVTYTPYSDTLVLCFLFFSGEIKPNCQHITSWETTTHSAWEDWVQGSLKHLEVCDEIGCAMSIWVQHRSVWIRERSRYPLHVYQPHVGCILGSDRVGADPVDVTTPVTGKGIHCFCVRAPPPGIKSSWL